MTLSIKEQILELAHSKPKHYVKLIQHNPVLKQWVDDNSLIESDRFVEKVYSAIFQVSNVCPAGNIKKFDRFSTGFVGCGPAKSCGCTKTAIALGVSNTKNSYNVQQRTEINSKRTSTMMSKYGVEYNSQRLEVKNLLSKPKISEDSYTKLCDFNWLNTEYNEKSRTLVDIANELGVYYSTVAEYCKKFNFKIRQVTNYSIQEREISDFIKSLGIDCESNNWDILGTRELDIVIPSKRLAIEVNGLYWHSYHKLSNRSEDPYQHITKTKLANNQGYEVLHVTDYEWQHKQDVIKNILKSKLGVNGTVYARKCRIELVQPSVERTFLEKYHLQGYVPSLLAVALTMCDQIQMILTLGKSRFNKQASYEVLRVCSVEGKTVVGGLSKLLSYVKNQFPNSSIISYCDLSKSSGNSYQTVGFSHTKDTDPGYFWTDGTHVISRYKAQKKNLKRWLHGYDETLSESQNMFNAGYRRYWDCGNRVFMLK
jgi:hypothetical protein